jgi:NADH dehydrogenase
MPLRGFSLRFRSLVEPIRKLCFRTRAHFIQARAESIEFSSKLVECIGENEDTGESYSFYVPFDKLVVAVGAETNTHNVEGVEHCHFLKTVNDARGIRNHFMDNLEKACLPTTTEEERKRLLSFVVCGGGPTGVEFAAELVDAFQEDIAPHFPRLINENATVTILQSASHILNTYDRKISEFAEVWFFVIFNISSNCFCRESFRMK